MDDQNVAHAIELLEQLIDSKGLEAVLNNIGFICSEKAAHVDSAWGDRTMARMWSRASDAVYKAGQGKAIQAMHDIGF